MLDAANAAGRQPAQPYREHQDQHQPEPEARHGKAEKRDDFADIVPRGIDLYGGYEPRRNADDERDRLAASASCRDAGSRWK